MRNKYKLRFLAQKESLENRYWQYLFCLSEVKHNPCVQIQMTLS